MRLPTLPPSALAAFARLHSVQLNGTSVSYINPEVGFGVLFHPEKYNAAHTPLLTVDKTLILSTEHVELAAKSDHWIRDVLRACCGLADGEQRQNLDGESGNGGDGIFDLNFDEEEQKEKIRPWGRNPRLMIMLFLAIVRIRAAVDAEESGNEGGQKGKAVGVGSGGIWSEYIKFLPPVSIPTTWTDEERALLRGTSLDSAVLSKKAALAREFNAFHHFTSSIPWCRKYLWNSSEPESTFTLSDWAQVDAWFRSRVLELPGFGLCLIPYLDMVNHSDDLPNAYYSLNSDGDVVLVPINVEDGGVLLLPNRRDPIEIRINYGAHKSSAELLFTYGFLNTPAPASPATCLWLSLPIPPNPQDILTQAKEVILDSPPTVKIIDVNTTCVPWISSEIWLVVTNSEDGLEFKVLQQTDGTRELKLYWRSEDDNLPTDTNENSVLIDSMDTLKKCLERSKLWEVYYLRAVVVLQRLVAEKLTRLHEAEEVIGTIEESARLASVEGGMGRVEHSPEQLGVRDSIVLLAKELRERERKLLEKSVNWFETEKERLVATDVVQRYLSRVQEEQIAGNEDDGEEEDLS